MSVTGVQAVRLLGRAVPPACLSCRAGGAADRLWLLAVRAVQLMTAYAYDQLRMGRVILRIAADNKGSVCVAIVPQRSFAKIALVL